MFYEKQEEFKKMLGDELKQYASKVFVEGRMGGIGHNDRFYIIENGVAIFLSWGDFSEDCICYPMLFMPSMQDAPIIKVYDTVYVTREGTQAKKTDASHVDFKALHQKYNFAFDRDEGRRHKTFDAASLIEHSWCKIENGEWFVREYNSKEFVKKEPELGRKNLF